MEDREAALIAWPRKMVANRYSEANDWRNSIKEYRFLNCRINLTTRQIFVSESLRHVRPRVFDLVVYLIENRDRVIPKDEIISEVWDHAALTESTVEVAILRARRALAGEPAGASLIKTYHRVGYRFMPVVELVELRSETGEQVKPASYRLEAGRESATRLALLPFQNDTGNPKLKWLELGLPSLVLHAIVRHSFIDVVPLSSTLSAIAQMEDRGSEPVRARTICELVGADCLITASVSLIAAEFSLSYRGYGTALVDLDSTIRGPELTALGLNLAADIERKLNPGGWEGVEKYPSDRFANECFARAMHASRAEQFYSAVCLFRLYLAIEPNSLEARVSYIRALAEHRDPQSVLLANALLEEARQRADSQLEAMAHYVGSISHFLVTRDLEAADLSIDLALALVPESCREDWYSHALTHKAQIHNARGEYEAALEAYAKATRAAELIGHRIRLGAISNNIGAIEYLRGNLLKAREVFVELAEYSRDMRAPHLERDAQINQGIVNASLGLFKTSVAGIERGVAMFREFKDPTKRFAISAVYLVAILAERREEDRCYRLANELKPLFWSDETSLAIACCKFAEAHIERSRGNLGGALERMVRAVKLVAKIRHFEALEQFIPFLAHVQARLGRTQELVQTQLLVQTHKELRQSRSLEGQLAHALATEARRIGSDDRAMACLEDAVRNVRTGLFLGYSLIDLAWMLLDRGQHHRAEVLIRSVEPWLQEHPAGLVLGARLEFLRGDFFAALALHRRHVEIVGGPERTRFAGLAAVYLAAVEGARIPEVQTVRCLPSGYPALLEDAP